MKMGLTVLLLPTLASASVFGGRAFTESLMPGGAAAAEDAPVPGTKYNVLIVTANVPVSFSEVKLQNGTATLGPKLGIAGGVSLILGKAVYHGDEKVTISPMFMLGLALETGVAAGASSIDGRFGGSVLVGLGPVGVSFGVDFIKGTVFFGLNARIDAFQLLEDAFIPLGKPWK